MLHSTPLYHFAHFVIGIIAILTGFEIDIPFIKYPILLFGLFYGGISLFNIIDTAIERTKNK